MNYSEILSFAGNVQLKPLSAINQRNYGFIKLKTAEPSLGLPSISNAITFDAINYFIPVIARDKTYDNSRKFTGLDTIFISGCKIAYNHVYPNFNFDINGSIGALSAFIPTVSTSKIYGDFLYIQNDIYFVNQVEFDYDANFISLTSNDIYTNVLIQNSSVYIDLNANENDIDNILNYNIDLSRINVNQNFTSNYLQSNSLSSFQLSAYELSSEYFNSNDVNVTQNIDAYNIFANNIHGNIDIDPNSNLYYTNNNLSFSSNQIFTYGIKPSDPYSTDSLSVDRTINGNWAHDSIEAFTSNEVLKPFFKTLQAAVNYVYSNPNKINGYKLNFYIYEDHQVNRVNSLPPQLKTQFHTTDDLKTNYPDVFNAGLSGGNFIWNDNTNRICYAHSIDIGGLLFKNIDIIGVYEIGSLIYTDGTKQFVKQKPFNRSPHKIIIRNYICNNPLIGYGNFKENGKSFNIKDWTEVSANNQVVIDSLALGNKSSNVNIQNLCLEVNQNSSYSATVHPTQNSTYRFGNFTIALLGKALYNYGAFTVEFGANVIINGTNQIDPYFLTPTTWNTQGWKSIKGATGPDYFPGWGFALVGQQDPTKQPVFLSTLGAEFGQKKGIFIINDDNIIRDIGRQTYLNCGVILDGSFYSQNFYRFTETYGYLSPTNYIFRNQNFTLSTANIKNSNGFSIIDVNSVNRINFKTINFASSYNIYDPKNYGLTPWTVKLDDNLSLTLNNNSNLVKNLNPNDSYWKFDINGNVDLSNSLNAISARNILVAEPAVSTDTQLINTVNESGLTLYDHYYYKINTPFDYNNTSYVLNYYSPGDPTYTTKQVPDPTLSNTPTQTPSNTPTPTITKTQTRTPTNTVTNTASPTISLSKTVTPTQSITPTHTPTISYTTTNTPTNSPSHTVSPTHTKTPRPTPTNTHTGTPTNTPTTSLRSSPTPTQTITKSHTPTHTVSRTPKSTPNSTPANTPNTTPNPTPHITHTRTPTTTKTPSRTPSQTRTQTRTPSHTPTKTPPVVHITITISASHFGTLFITSDNGDYENLLFRPRNADNTLQNMNWVTRSGDWNGVNYLALKVIINPGVTLSADAVCTNILNDGTPHYAMIVGNYNRSGGVQTSTFRAHDKIQIINNGAIIGVGGNGGDGGTNGGNGGDGWRGGPAMLIYDIQNITVSGFIRGGSGGNGGNGSYKVTKTGDCYMCVHYDDWRWANGFPCSNEFTTGGVPIATCTSTYGTAIGTLFGEPPNQCYHYFPENYKYGTKCFNVRNVGSASYDEYAGGGGGSTGASGGGADGVAGTSYSGYGQGGKGGKAGYSIICQGDRTASISTILANYPNSILTYGTYFYNISNYGI